MVTYRCCWILAFLQAQKLNRSPSLKPRVSRMMPPLKPPPPQTMYILWHLRQWWYLQR